MTVLILRTGTETEIETD